MNKLTGIACALVACLPCAAQAQIGSTTTTTTTTSSAPATIRASQILGSSVHLQGTNDFGKVEDLLLSEEGGPTYLVVATNGRQVLMPLNAATFDQGARAVSYNVTTQAIQPLYFNQNAYPNINDQQFVTRTNQVFPATGEKMKFKVKPNGVIKEKIRNP